MHSVCGNLQIFPPRFFCKNSVKLTFSLKSYAVNQFDEKFFQWGKISENTTYVQLFVFLTTETFPYSKTARGTEIPFGVETKTHYPSARFSARLCLDARRGSVFFVASNPKRIY